MAAALAGRTLYEGVTPPYGVRLLVAQMDHIAVRSVSIISVAGKFLFNFDGAASCALNPVPCQFRPCPGEFDQSPPHQSSR